MSNPPSSSPPRHSNSPVNPTTTTSRTAPHEQLTFVAELPSSFTHTRTPSPPHSFGADPTQYTATPTISSSRRYSRPADPRSSEDRRPSMSRRIRPHTPQHEEASGSRDSSSDSQSGMADTEEAGSGRQSERAAPPSNPPKKKRTRTLTTPHQSAVLHALLAQSRFPTTAMREEVGRSIGLSARKVQIWFQNQRQKARRPRTQGDIPLTRPPQYGPYPTSAPSSAARSERGIGSMQPSQGNYIQVPEYQPSLGGGYGAPQASTSTSTPRYLLGPGIPGSAPPSQPSYWSLSSAGVSPTESRYGDYSSSPRERVGPYPSPRTRGSPVERRRSDFEYPTGRSAYRSNPLGSLSSGRGYIMRRTPSPGRTLPLPVPSHPSSAPLGRAWEPTQSLPPMQAEEGVRLSPIRSGIHPMGQYLPSLPPIAADYRLPVTPRQLQEPEPVPEASTSYGRPAGRYDPVRAMVVPYRTPTPPTTPPHRPAPE